MMIEVGWLIPRAWTVSPQGRGSSDQRREAIARCDAGDETLTDIARRFCELSQLAAINKGL